MNKLLQFPTSLALTGLLLIGTTAAAQSTQQSSSQSSSSRTTQSKKTTTVMSHGEKEKATTPRKTMTLDGPKERTSGGQSGSTSAKSGTMKSGQNQTSSTTMSEQTSSTQTGQSGSMSGAASGNTRAGGMTSSQGVMVGGAMMQPSRNLVDNAAMSREHTTLVQLVQTAGLGETLKGTGPFTVFAPTNEAFEMLPAGTNDKLMQPAMRAKLRYVLQNHVVQGKLMANDLVDGQQLATVGGGLLTVVKKDGQTMVRDSEGHTATVRQADVASSNGVTHVIDMVLLPDMGTSASSTSTTGSQPTTPSQSGQPTSPSPASPTGGQ